MEAIRLADLKKSFAGKPALHGLSFSVERGEIFGLLGHNGAGKSTALGILLGMVFPDEGEAFVGGISVHTSSATYGGLSSSCFTLKSASQPNAVTSVSYTHLTLPTILRV